MNDCPGCWHPDLHRGRWRPLSFYVGANGGSKLVCPTCHPPIGSPPFERQMRGLRAHMDTTGKRVT